MRTLFITAALAALLPLAAACASRSDGVKNSVAAVVQDESARQKVVNAIQNGATPDEAMDKVAAGPKNQAPN